MGGSRGRHRYFPRAGTATPTFVIRISGFVIHSSFGDSDFIIRNPNGPEKPRGGKRTASPCFASKTCYTGVEAEAARCGTGFAGAL